jgi:hypothetical protein
MDMSGHGSIDWFGWGLIFTAALLAGAWVLLRFRWKWAEADARVHFSRGDGTDQARASEET